jgi:hypothetical protein
VSLINQSWNKLARMAGKAPAEEAALPFGFSTRVVAAWKSASSEKFFAALEGLTWRGLAVALVIFGGCAFLGYDSFVSALSGEEVQAGTLLSDWFGL